MSMPHGAQANRLLDRLPLAHFHPLAEQPEPAPIRLGDVIYKPGQHLLHACFPTTAIVSLDCLVA